MLKSNQQGMGLLEVIIASAILVVILKFMHQALQNFSQFQKNEENQMSEIFIRNYLNELSECGTTMSELNYTCSPTNEVRVISRYIDEEGNDLPLIKTMNFDGEYTEVGRTQLRAVCAECVDCNSGLKIEVQMRKLTSTGKVKKNPLTGKKDWKNLYRNINFQCLF